jgi:hypothetical protein
VTGITPFPDPPSSTDPDDFDAAADAFFDAFPTFVTEANLYAAFLAAAAQGPLVIPYTFSTTTTVGDPGPGVLRLGSATQNAAIALLLDVLDANGADRTTQIDTFDDATSVLKGMIGISKVGDPTKFLVFNLTAVATPAGYRNLTVACKASSAASPFANADAVLVTFVPAGDVGTSPQCAHFRQERTSGSAPSDTAIAGSFVTRVLNTTALNAITGCSLASNQITLPAGTYEVIAFGMAGNANTGGSAAQARLRLYNVTDAAVLLNGLPVRPEANASNRMDVPAPLIGQFTLAAQKVVSLDQWSSGAADFGAAMNTTSVVEVYNEIYLRKVA